MIVIDRNIGILNTYYTTNPASCGANTGTISIALRTRTIYTHRSSVTRPLTTGHGHRYIGKKDSAEFDDAKDDQEDDRKNQGKF
jgi:hypothetical protein